MIGVPHMRSLGAGRATFTVMTARIAVAALAGLVGATFLLQGLGYLEGSVMTGDPFWAVVGAGLLVVALVLAVIALGPRSP